MRVAKVAFLNSWCVRLRRISSPGQDLQRAPTAPSALLPGTELLFSQHQAIPNIQKSAELLVAPAAPRPHSALHQHQLMQRIPALLTLSCHQNHV